MRSLYALVIGALLLSNALPSSAQTTPAPSPTPATAAASFTAPADWVQLPRGFTLTEIKNVWQGPKMKKGRGGSGVFVQAVLPIPSGIVSAGIAQLRTVLSKSKTPLRATTKSASICGASASVSTVQVGKGAGAATVETTTLSQRGIAYETVYVRTAGLQPDPGIESAVRSSCPLPNGGLPDLTPPAGWNPLQKGLDFELAGIWLGNAPFQVMWMFKARGVPSIMSAAEMAPSTTSGTQHSVKYRATLQKPKFCGTPGLLATAQFTVPPGFGMTTSLAAAQGTDGTFILFYVHPSSYTDAGAQQSMRTLCAGGALPSPSPSATPLPFP